MNKEEFGVGMVFIVFGLTALVGACLGLGILSEHVPKSRVEEDVCLRYKDVCLYILRLASSLICVITKENLFNPVLLE